MTLWEVEQFLHQTSDVEGGRSISDSWDMSAVLPDGSFDPEVLKQTILLKGGELGVTFNNIATYYMQCMWWWKKWLPTFTRWWMAEDSQYEPLWDRNGWEEVEDHTDEVGTLDTETTANEVMDDDTSFNTHSSSNSSTENKVSAFDSNTYQPHDTSSTTASSSESGTGTDDRTTNATGTVDTDTTGQKDYTHSMHSWGNWGISQTSQKLLEAEYQTRYKYNPYELMSDVFLKEMTDCVWI